jgi:hypothetical protein
MSLIEIRFFEVIKKQYVYKFKAFMNMFYGLVVAQLVALLLSLGGTMNLGTSSNTQSINVSIYSNDISMLFTMLWFFCFAWLLTTQKNRDIDFAFISTRVSSGISTMLFLLTSVILGAIMTTLNSFLLRDIIYLISGSQNIVGTNFFIAPYELIIGLISAILYLLLLSALGYFLGSLIQLNKIIAYLLPPLIICELIIDTKINNQPTTIITIAKFFLSENVNSLAIFAVKVIIVSALLFYGAILLSKRLEVRK